MTDPPEPAEPAAELVEVAHACFDFARHGDTARLLAYVAAGVPVDLTDAGGNTLVMLAAYHGHADAVLGLAAAGADVDGPNDRGQTPVAGAVFKGEDEDVRALLEHRADPDRGSGVAVAPCQASPSCMARGR